MHAFSGIPAALLERQRSGRGMHLRSRCSTRRWASWAISRRTTGAAASRRARWAPRIPPWRRTNFEAADGPVMIGVGNDAQWQRFCPVAGLQEVADSPRFATNAARVAHFDETVALVQARIATQPVAYWLEALRRAGVACAPIHTLTRRWPTRNRARAGGGVRASAAGQGPQHRPAGALPRRGAPGTARRRCSASTPTRSCARPATAPRRSPG